MSEPIVLLISLGEEYDRLFALVREQTNLRKCRSWFDRTAILGDVRVEITGQYISIQYETKKGQVSDRCGYDSVSELTELKDGVAVRLSKGRMLFLPAGGDRGYQKQLMAALSLMEQHMRYRFQDCPMKLRGIGPRDRLVFRLRPRRGIPFSLHRVTGSLRYCLIAIICATVLLASMFVYMPFYSYKIEPEKAIRTSAALTEINPHYRDWSLRGIALVFDDGQRLETGIANRTLLDSLEALPTESKLELWIHPKSQDILQIQAYGRTILEFDQAMGVAWNNARAFGVMGVFLYAGVAYIWYDVFFKRRKR